MKKSMLLFIVFFSAAAFAEVGTILNNDIPYFSIEGKWRSRFACDGSCWEATYEERTISGNHLKIVYETYGGKVNNHCNMSSPVGSATCQKVVTEVYEATLLMGQAIDDRSQELDIHYDSFTLTMHDPYDVELANKYGKCGLFNWKIDTPQPIARGECFEAETIYSKILISPHGYDEMFDLHFGRSSWEHGLEYPDRNGSTPHRRHVRVGPRFFRPN
jgi:hypothetical protein